MQNQKKTSLKNILLTRSQEHWAYNENHDRLYARSLWRSRAVYEHNVIASAIRNPKVHFSYIRGWTNRRDPIPGCLDQIASWQQVMRKKLWCKPTILKLYSHVKFPSPRQFHKAEAMLPNCRVSKKIVTEHHNRLYTRPVFLFTRGVKDEKPNHRAGMANWFHENKWWEKCSNFTAPLSKCA